MVIRGGRDDAGADAGTPGGAAPGRSRRTNGSADRAAGPSRPGRQRREWSSSRPAPTDHRTVLRVNRDASLSLAAPASGPSGQRACGGRDGSPDSAARPAEPSGGASGANTRRRSSADRGRSNGKQSPAGGNRHTGTDGPTPDRPLPLRSSGVDARRPRQDTWPACLPGTMWGTAPMLNLQVVRGAVLTPNTARALPRRPLGSPRPLSPHGRARHSASPHCPGQQAATRPWRMTLAATAPSMRAFTAPVT